MASSNNLTNPTIDTTTSRFSAGQKYSYDKNGNLTADANGKQFLYDGENHQKEVKDEQNQTIAIYLYDSEGRRIKKVLPNSSEETIFVYGISGQLAAEYVINPVTQIESPSTKYLTADHLGSPRIFTNESYSAASRKHYCYLTRNIAPRNKSAIQIMNEDSELNLVTAFLFKKIRNDYMDYIGFGEETSKSQRATSLVYQPNKVRQGYTGYEQDTESGSDFAQARYYNSAHGRFTSVDSLTANANVKNPQTFNRYSYVLNSPYKYTDPLGLISDHTGMCGDRRTNCGDYVDGLSFLRWRNYALYKTNLQQRKPKEIGRQNCRFDSFTRSKYEYDQIIYIACSKFDNEQARRVFDST